MWKLGSSLPGNGKSVLQVTDTGPSIGEYWNIFGVPVLQENVIFMFFKTSWCYSEAYNTGMQKWSSIVQYSCTSIWDLKYTFSGKFSLLSSPACMCISMNETSSDSVLPPDFIFKI